MLVSDNRFDPDDPADLSDDERERVQRLTELARRVVLAEEPDVRLDMITVEVEHISSKCLSVSACNGRFHILCHPRALEALEAALVVLGRGL